MSGLITGVLWVVIGIAVVYLLLIMPRMINKADASEFWKVMYAHRGVHDNETEAPENSLPAFQKAVQAGFGIELDIQLTKDKVPVAFHDESLERVCGVKGKVCEHTFEELQQLRLCKSGERIPKFEDVLKLVNGQVPLIIEFKGESTDTALCPVADKVLREYKGPYCMESFNPMMVYWYRRNHPEIMRGQLSDAFCSSGKYHSALYFLLEHLLFNFLTKPDFVAYNHEKPGNLSRVLCRKLFGNTAVAWTIKSEEQLDVARNHFDAFIFDSFIPKK